MRSLDDHVAAVIALATRHAPRSHERAAVASAVGRVTAAEHVAVHPSPAFDNSAMDGYAVRAEDLATASDALPVALAVVGEARAGMAPPTGVVPGTAVRIMTGAPLPAGADAVVPQELAARDGDTVAFTAAPAPGAHIRRLGEDLRPGDAVLGAGVVLEPRHVAAAAAAGLGHLSVIAAPRVGFLVTGDELVVPGAPLAEGQIHDSNGVYLATALPRLGARAVDLGRVGDEPAAVLAAIAGAEVDLVVTTGGASVGDHDPVKAALADQGVDFTRVAMQPGKPQGIGTVGGTPVLCLPGNPVAVAVSVELLVGAAVRAMLGVPEPSWLPAVAAAAWSSPAGREQIIPVTVEHRDPGADDGEGAALVGPGERRVSPATSGGSGSHLAGRLAVADALARVPAGVTAVVPGDSVLVRRFTA